MNTLVIEVLRRLRPVVTLLRPAQVNFQSVVVCGVNIKRYLDGVSVLVAGQRVMTEHKELNDIGLRLSVDKNIVDMVTVDT